MRALGLAGETGEVVEKIKKFYRDDLTSTAKADRILSRQRRDEIIAELGDVLWYIAAIADTIDCDLSVVADRNLRKLQERTDRNVLQGSGDKR